MPAIQPARMKIQVASLVEKMRQPEAFIRSMHNLLDLYADRTHRPGQSGEPPALLASYKTPPPVFRQIIREIDPLARADPPAALSLVDALWAEPYIEFRQLAIILISKISPASYEPVLSRIQAWIASKPENILLDSILEQGLQPVKQAYPKIFFRMIEDWMKADSIYLRQAGLRALIPLFSDPDFENLPAVIRNITPIMRGTPPELRLDLVAVLRAMARRFPQEASFVLRQNLSPDHPDTIWLARQVLQTIPGETQDSLREALRRYNIT